MDQKIEVEEEIIEESKAFLSILRQVVMAGIGAVNLAQTEVEGLISKLVDKGDIAEKDGRSLINEFMQKRKQRVEESSKRVEAEIEQRMENLLNRMNIPSKKAIENLTQKVAALSEKVDALKK